MPYHEQSHEIHTLFKSLMKKVGDAWNRDNDTGLSVTHYRMLHALVQKGKQKVAELAECLQVTPGAVTGLADKLIERGYVVRNRDQDDRRVVYLAVTPQGRTLKDAMEEKHQALYGRLFEQLPETDIAHLKRIFGQMIDAVNRIEKE
ncbi:MarR family transcriptional regulator [Paenibacillus sp. IB182496]|uniref:MarR family transcriptional regulator n=1 Tax=Paenibacillus sabuli TaxID=2772509 RepID=A0A927GTL0_9BACL|nr:MarR family transcriptional regulator [Paenibacillus sabuli]MBD2846842.1 MarR family transcriptional regulator [Paenibacillus sabuli]